ncbi:hypothetical protein [Fodinibius salsisoli]|uniref:PD-(D/E)XK nuclease superfamily protein n=1 Tax=Fodinibius salsisoli TaxID=2820877 RepID=A0ABT3PJ58_9BACT|nr:hypothetical protein [Fodinibius salsisoli]MCW9705788.1 hypothetical protein [Fodinibius salsisoli]
MNDFDEFTSLLKIATQAINERFFNLPVAGQEESLYRERVYCYELYHQLRTNWPADLNEYTLSGEIDKSGHHLIDENVIPDLLIHIPGKMEGNLVIVEVKPVNFNREGIKNDLKKLTSFQREANYDHAIHLTYGSDGNEQIILEESRMIQKDNVEEIDLDLIEFWNHDNPGNEAKILK